MAKRKYTQTVKKKEGRGDSAPTKVVGPQTSSEKKVGTTAGKTTSETPDYGQDNRQPQSSKHKKGWVKIIAVVLRFLMKKPVAASTTSETTSDKSSADQEALWINGIKVVATEDMDEKRFAALSPEAKMVAIKDRLRKLMSAQGPETPNVAATEANVPVVTGNPAGVEAQRNEEVDENSMEQGVNPADTTKGDVATETTEMQSSDNNSTELNTVESGQQKNGQGEDDATNVDEDQGHDSDKQEGTDGSGETTKTFEKVLLELTKENNTLKEEKEKLESTNTGLNTELKELRKECTDLKTANTTLTNTLKEEKEKLEGAKTKLNELTREYANLENAKENLTEEYNKFKTAHDQYKVYCEELEASEVGQLDAKIKELQEAKTAVEQKLEEIQTAKETVDQQLQEAGKTIENQKGALQNKNNEITSLQEAKTAVEQKLEEIQTAKETVDQQLQEAGKTIENQKGALQEKKKAIKTLTSTIEKQKEQIGDLTTTNNGLNTEIEKQRNELAVRQATIDRQTEEIGKLEKDKDSLQEENTVLNRTVEGLKQEKEKLTQAKKEAEQELGKKTELICAERDDFAKMMMSLTNKLSAAAAEDFLGCCDDKFEDNRTSLQEKVLKSIRRLEREMAEIKPENYASRDELAEAYHTLIKSQFDEPSGLTRIAQWYAYSQVAFMVDKDRADGLFIYQEKVRDMYRLAVSLMGHVGLEYCLPALYTEHLSGNSPYDDVTGQRQLNIEYMCPTARRRKENIDCVDSSQVIIDIVEVGYTDAKGVSKKSQVII